MAENIKTESAVTHARSWGQRAELIGLGAVGTAAGVALVELGKRFLGQAVAEQGVHHAAAFGRSIRLLFR